MSNILAVSVALKKASVALEHDGLISTSIFEDDMSSYFVGFVSEFLNKFELKFSDLDKLIVASGPGSFTGLRIGISFVKALHELNNIPVICATYFEVMNMLYPDITPDIMIINSENPNEFYFQKRGKNPSIGLISDGLPGAHNVVICEPSNELKINCVQKIICENLKSAKHLLLLKDFSLDTSISPLYIKPPYTERCAKNN